MSDDEADKSETAPRKRGEAAWKEHKDQIAERNAKTKKAGQARRASYEKERAEARHAANIRYLTAVRDAEAKR